MRNYELVLVLRPNLAESARKKIVESVKSMIKGAKFTTEQDWGSKALSYPIKKELTGHYFDFILETELIAADFEKKLLNIDEVLRHLLIRRK